MQPVGGRTGIGVAAAKPPDGAKLVGAGLPAMRWSARPPRGQARSYFGETDDLAVLV